MGNLEDWEGKLESLWTPGLGEDWASTKKKEEVTARAF